MVRYMVWHDLFDEPRNIFYFFDCCTSFVHLPYRMQLTPCFCFLVVCQAEPCTLAGTSDPEVMFRMGEDTRSCMGIQRACIKTNRGLLG